MGRKKLSSEYVREVVQNELGIELDDLNIVHVINKNKPITRDNILIFATRSDYQRYRSDYSGKYVFDKKGDFICSRVSLVNTCICAQCGNYFNPKDAIVYGDAALCSTKCLKKYIRPIFNKLPDISESSRFYKKEMRDGYYKDISIDRMLCSINTGYKINSLLRSVYLNGNHCDFSKSNLVMMENKMAIRFAKLKKDDIVKYYKYDEIGVVGFGVMDKEKDTYIRYKHICKNCGKEFYSRVKTSVYCSMNCRNEGHSRFNFHKKGLMYQIRHLPNPYRRDLDKQIPKRTMLASVALGFVIPVGMFVTFKDRDRLNYDKDNLILLSREDSNRWYRTIDFDKHYSLVFDNKKLHIGHLVKKSADLCKKCEYCGEEYTVKNKKEFVRRRFCSHRCSALYSHKQKSLVGSN